MASHVTAGLGRRLGALLYDGVLILALWLVITTLHLVFFQQVLGRPAQAVWASALGVWSLRGLLVVATTLFFCFFWRRAGMTLGMQAWRLQVQTLNGQPLSLKQCLMRCATGWLCLAALGLGYWWVIVDRQRRSWPDMASHTRTVLLPKR
ncbi:RDD family protein [Vreelandella populi]|uniref:RDD family protein n=1 Tax=Vreelandella populi TaxID=2498858 RepID=A0A433LD14_9GAMM|nr:RDD family protein [Halomonas populi]RUR39529.1 RDD family protein [Halomonas populi]RUR46641.1 RDD family protein [Halomonas populi]RUR52849.1 RDD family protein [Halomonas populi]